MAGSDDGVRDAGFVFKTEECEALRSPRALAANDAAGDANDGSVARVFDGGRAEDSARVELFAAHAHRMDADGHARAAEVGDDALLLRHDFEWRKLLLRIELLRAKGQRVLRRVRFAKGLRGDWIGVAADPIEGSDFGELAYIILAHFGDAASEVLNAGERCAVRSATIASPTVLRRPLT